MISSVKIKNLIVPRSNSYNCGAEDANFGIAFEPFPLAGVHVINSVRFQSPAHQVRNLSIMCFRMNNRHYHSFSRIPNLTMHYSFYFSVIEFIPEMKLCK